MGILEKLSWNAPSWSISVEFYTYLLFGLLVLLVSRLTPRKTLGILIASAGLMALSLAIMHAYPYDGAKPWYPYVLKANTISYFRCVYSFFAGVVCHQLFMRFYLHLEKLPDLAFSIGEALCTVAATLLVTFLPKPMPFYLGLLYAVLIFTFAFEKGTLSRLLKGKAWQRLGLYSYSIYMTHAFFLKFAKPVFFKLKIATFGAWACDLWFLAFALVSISFSHLTYTYIEMKFGKDWLGKFILPKKVSSIAPTYQAPVS